jgi:pimeloyl-ACP methyl ester carboxylesterase
MGAGVAAGVGAAAPEHVRLLVLVAGTPGLRRPTGIPFAWALYIPAVRRALDAWAAWQLVDEDNIRKLLASAFDRPPTDDELAGYFHPLTIPDTYPSLLVRMNRRSESVPQGWDRVPLAVLWGEQDEWVEIDRIRPWLEGHSELRAFETIDQAGHNPMDTHPEAFNDWLLIQLRTQPQKPPQPP